LFYVLVLYVAEPLSKCQIAYLYHSQQDACAGRYNHRRFTYLLHRWSSIDNTQHVTLLLMLM